MSCGKSLKCLYNRYCATAKIALQHKAKNLEVALTGQEVANELHNVIVEELLFPSSGIIFRTLDRRLHRKLNVP